jgi:hypothetical protein
MVRKILLIILVGCLTIIISCESNPVEQKATPGRRDYVWTRDTLKADPEGFQFLTGIWGSSPSDVWVIGDAATYVNKIWHYDGAKWKNYLLDQFATPVEICGVSSSEIWMVTTMSDIWRYDGTRWYKHTTIVPEGYQRILFEDIYGYLNDMYAVGIAEKSNGDYTGIIVHYNGIEWSVVRTPQIKEYFNSVKYVKGGDVLIEGIDYSNPDEDGRLYKIKNGNLTLIQKSSGEYRLGILNNKLYVNTNKKIYEYRDGSLIESLDLSNTGYLGGLFGRTIEDFFSANTGWNLGQYNGEEMINIYPAQGNIIDAFIFEKDVFVICYTLDNVNYVLHGILK